MKKKDSNKIGLKENEIRATFVVDKNTLERFKTYSWVSDVPIKKLINEALNDYTRKEKICSLIDKAISVKKESNT